MWIVHDSAIRKRCESAQPWIRSTRSILQTEVLVASLLLVAMPGAPSSFLLLVVWPGAPSSVLAPSSSETSCFAYLSLTQPLGPYHKLYARGLARRPGGSARRLGLPDARTLVIEIDNLPNYPH